MRSTTEISPVRLAAGPSGCLLALTLMTSVPTQAQNIEDVDVWRTTLRVAVCDRNDAGTDSRIRARLRDEYFNLSLGHNEFKRGQTDVFEIVVDDVTTIGDIRWIELLNTGRDRLCIDRVDLIVNHPSATGLDQSMIYRTDEDLVISSRDRDPDRFLVSREELRASPLWNLEGSRALIPGVLRVAITGMIERPVLVGIIEAIVGDAVSRESRIGWGRRYNDRHVELSPTSNPNVVSVDLDLGRGGRDTRLARIDVDFELTAACDASADAIVISAANFRVDARWLFGWQRLVERKLKAKLARVAGEFGRSIDLGGTDLCDRVRIEFDNDANLVLQAR